MLNLRVTVIVLSMILLFSVGAAFAQGDSVVELASAQEDLSTFVTLLDVAGLTESVDNLPAATVFAPSNAAFEALPATTVGYLQNNPDVLAEVLQYHVLPEERRSTDFIEEAVSLQGGVLILQHDEAGSALVDGVPVRSADLEASNGVLHIIDDLLAPAVELPALDPLDFTSGTINAAGSSTVFPLAEQIAVLWSDAGGNAPTIDSIGSGAGFERFCVAGETDISNASRAIRPEEVEQCEEIGRSPIEFRVGTDALAVTVSEQNDFLSNVTLEELALIFGEARTWADVNPDWPDEAIYRFIPGTDSGTFDYFVEEVFDEDATRIVNASNLNLSEDDNVLVAGIEQNPYAIGFFGYAYYLENQDSLQSLSINGVAPTAESAEDNSYPLARPLFIYSDAGIMQQKPQVAAFINYFLTNVNEEIVRVGYFPASDRTLNLARLHWLGAVGE